MPFKHYTAEEIQEIIKKDNNAFLRDLAATFCQIVESDEFLTVDDLGRYKMLTTAVGNRAQELLPDADFETLNALTFGYVTDFLTIVKKSGDKNEAKQEQN